MEKGPDPIKEQIDKAKVRKILFKRTLISGLIIGSFGYYFFVQRPKIKANKRKADWLEGYYLSGGMPPESRQQNSDNPETDRQK